MGNNKSQISLEYIITLAILIIFISPLIYFSFSTFSITSKVYNAEMMVSRLVEAADDVYAQGWPSQQVLTILFPEDLQSIVIDNKTIATSIAVSAGNTTTFRTTKGCVTGELPLSGGLKNVLIKAEKNTCVNISEWV